jgi:hypothetical protein
VPAGAEYTVVLRGAVVIVTEHDGTRWVWIDPVTGLLLYTDPECVTPETVEMLECRCIRVEIPSTN